MNTNEALYRAISLHAMEIQVEPALVGSKRAIRFGNGPIIVSPAMYDLIRSASPDELRLLLETIRIQQLPALPSVSDLVTLPMFSAAREYFRPKEES